MYQINSNISEIKLELFRFIDNLPENELQRFYNFLILSNKDKTKDPWELFSEWEKEDINIGISDLENGKIKKIEDVLDKY